MSQASNMKHYVNPICIEKTIAIVDYC